MRVSAIVPAYNAERYLTRAVESLIATGYHDLEIVIVDDGSADSTLEVAHALRDSHSQVQVFSHPHTGNLGVSASRNLGIERSSGLLLCFLDADDFVYPHRFATAVPMLIEDSTIDGIYETTRIISTSAENPWWDGNELFGLSRAVSDDGLLSELLTGQSWHTGGIVVRRRLIDRTGGFHPHLKIAEDCHLWFRMASVGRIVAGNASEPVSAYCRHDQNTYQVAQDRKLDMVVSMLDAYAWTRRNRIGGRVRERFERGVQAYILNSIIVAREHQRPDLAMRLWSVLARSRYGLSLVNGPILRQLPHALLELSRTDWRRQSVVV